MIVDKNACHRERLILYTTATCNLNCKYCYIDKNPALIEIDKLLDESFKGDYYTDFTKKLFPKRNQLKQVEFWGGEPTMRLDRAVYTVNNLIQIYPALKSFFMSTNFTISNWNEQFFSFVELLESYPERKFEFNLQLSLDGPMEITDSQRGRGVYGKFKKQFEKFIEFSNTWKENSNVRIRLMFKPTLTSEIIEAKLSTKEDIIRYYKEFEDFVLYFNEHNKRPDHVRLTPPIPNTASPSPHTQHDGLVFAEFCKNCYEIEQEHKENKIFQLYNRIMPYGARIEKNHLRFDCNAGGCGSGKSHVGLLPYNYVSHCHNGFVDLLGDYKKYADGKKDGKVLDFRMFLEKTHPMLCKYEDYEKYEKNVAYAYDPNDKAKMANRTNLIMLLALNGQIDEKYKDVRNALDAAIFLNKNTAYCFRDNTAMTGSYCHTHIGIIRLLLNGAKEWIEKS